MLKKIETLEEYKKIIGELEQKIDDSSKRNDMIIFDELTKCLSEIKLEYSKFEEERIKSL